MSVMTIDSLSGLSGRRKRRKPAKRRGLKGAEATCKEIKRVKRTRTVWVCPTGISASSASRTVKAKRCRKKKVARTELVCASFVRKGQKGYRSTSALTSEHRRAQEAVKRSKGRKVSMKRRKR